MTSLFAVFFRKWWKRYRKCVSPLLMGAVLALCSGIDAFASTNVTVPVSEVDIINDTRKRDNISGYTDNFSMYPTSIDIISVSSGASLGNIIIKPMDPQVDYSGFYNESTGIITMHDVNTRYSIDGQDISFDQNVKLLCHYDFDYRFAFRFENIDSKHVNKLQLNTYPRLNCILPGSNSTTYSVYSGEYQYNDFFSTGWTQFEEFDMIGKFSKYFSISVNAAYVYEGSDVNISDLIYKFQFAFLPESSSFSYDILVVYQDQNDDLFSDIESNTGQIADQQQQFHDQDQSDATSAGQAMSGVAADLENVKNKWEILWYPIEFTHNVMSAFQGTQAVSYNLNYGNISGYTYNESLGLLEPVYSKTRSGSPGSATITFPEYTLPVLNVKLWDSYSYDMSSLKEQFPALFDALYVFVSMLEVFLFVGFLRKKYNEVFRR